jgi:hypothetical protein
LAVGTGGDFVGAGGAGGATLTVTSTTFTSGSAIPVMNTCAGADVSPELEWSAGPAGTKGYAVALLDTSAASPIDWIVWDIPAATTSLPARLPAGTTLSSPAGARQLGVGGDGYVGPCPPSAQGQQSYVYGVFAVDVAVLSGLPASATTLDVFSAVSQHMLADGGLLGVSSRP